MRTTLKLIIGVTLIGPSFASAIILTLHRNFDVYFEWGSGAIRYSMIEIAPTETDTITACPEPSGCEWDRHLEEVAAHPDRREELVEAFHRRADIRARSLFDPRFQTYNFDFQRRAILKNHREAMRLLRVGYDHAKLWYEASGRYKRADEGGGPRPLSPELERDMRSALSGEQRMLLFFPYRHFDDPVQTFAGAYETADGRSPPVDRLLGRGLDRGFDPIPERIYDGKIPFFSMSFPGKHFDLADELFSMVPIVEAGRIVLKMNARDPEWNVPWFPFIREIISPLGWFQPPRYPTIEVPPLDDMKIFDKFCRLRERGFTCWEEKLALSHAYLTLMSRRNSLNNRAWVAEIVAEAVGAAPQRLYQGSAGFRDEFGGTIIDPDLTAPGETDPKKIITVKLLTQPRSRWEIERPEDWNRHHLTTQPYVRTSYIASVYDDEGPEDCAVLVSEKDTILERMTVNRLPHSSRWSGGRKPIDD